MPIYEFYCQPCDAKFEKLVLKKGQQIACPKCRNLEVRRLISACSFGSADGTVRPSSEKSCSSCTASSCSSCGGGH